MAWSAGDGNPDPFTEWPSSVSTGHSDLEVVFEEGPNEGESTEIWRIPTGRPTLSRLFGCPTLGELDGTIVQPSGGKVDVDYEGSIWFGLLTQLPKELSTDISINSYCIIDRNFIYVRKLYGGNTWSTVLAEDERAKLIGITPIDAAASDGSTYVNDAAGRYKQVIDILKDDTILSKIIEPGPGLANNIDPNIPVEPQVFERFLIKRILEEPFKLLTEQNGALSTVLLDAIDSAPNAQFLPGKSKAIYELYGSAMKYIIRHFLSFI